MRVRGSDLQLGSHCVSCARSPRVCGGFLSTETSSQPVFESVMETLSCIRRNSSAASFSQSEVQRRDSPCVHEDVGEEPPGLGAELRVVGQGALQEGRAGHLQNQSVQLEAVVHEHGDLKGHTGGERSRLGADLTNPITSSGSHD